MDVDGYPAEASTDDPMTGVNICAREYLSCYRELNGSASSQKASMRLDTVCEAWTLLTVKRIVGGQ